MTSSFNLACRHADFGSLGLLNIRKFRSHRWIATRQPLDRNVLRLVVSEAQVAVGAEQGLLGLLQVIDGFIDLLNGGLEAALSEVVVL